MRRRPERPAQPARSSFAPGQPDKGLYLSELTRLCFEKFRGVQLVDRSVRRVRREIDLRDADELVEPADDARVAAARPQLGEIEEKTETDEEHEERGRC